jgi:hypothetical protein
MTFEGANVKLLDYTKGGRLQGRARSRKAEGQGPGRQDHQRVHHHPRFHVRLPIHLLFPDHFVLGDPKMFMRAGLTMLSAEFPEDQVKAFESDDKLNVEQDSEVHIQ